jgi:hypothetical protein
MSEFSKGAEFLGELTVFQLAKKSGVQSSRDERSLLCRADPAAGIYSEPILAHITPFFI